MEHTTKITKSRLSELEDIELKMQALEAGGVENWEWYGESLEKYNKDKEFKEKLENDFLKMLEILGSGAYEPSERGGGFAFNMDSEESALKIFKDAVKSARNDKYN